ncbi:MAG: DUF1028 domain-containing protein [Planctomycetes bacterium]|nr:DUF1028 domain-containing protein [Planctomycetota bacterium]
MKPLQRLRRLAARAASLGIALATLTSVAQATWSIVIVDRATGEVCVASATCLANFSIEKYVPVLVVGKGVGAAQSAVDTTGVNRVLIRDGIVAGDDPATILANLAATDGQHHQRQYGLVTLDGGAPVSFTGSGAGPAKISLTGEVGSLRYAMQGNVLAGQAVLVQAEQTLLATEGDLVTRVMAAMQTARFMGGDGRCSCSAFLPASCGAPPPSFTHSAYTAQIALARVGDFDGTCSANGCANGTYFLREKVSGNGADDDPVARLQRRVDHWRDLRLGRVDHVLSTVTPAATRLPADGLTGSEVIVRLADIDGTPITTQANQLVFTAVTPGGASVTLGAPVWLGDDRYLVPVDPSTTPGPARFRVEVWHDWQMTRLYPDLELAVDAPAPLHVGQAAVSSSAGGSVPFTVDLGAAHAGQPYLMLLSGAGTQPGTPFGGLVLPLNADRLLTWSLTRPNVASWPGSHGLLDAAGRANATLTTTPDQLVHYVGGRLDFCVLTAGQVSPPAGFDVLP